MNGPKFTVIGKCCMIRKNVFHFDSAIQGLLRLFYDSVNAILIDRKNGTKNMDIDWYLNNTLRSAIVCVSLHPSLLVCNQGYHITRVGETERA